jgi:hypothetical protein
VKVRLPLRSIPPDVVVAVETPQLSSGSSCRPQRPPLPSSGRRPSTHQRARPGRADPRSGRGTAGSGPQGTRRRKWQLRQRGHSGEPRRPSPPRAPERERGREPCRCLPREPGEMSAHSGGGAAGMARERWRRRLGLGPSVARAGGDARGMRFSSAGRLTMCLDQPGFALCWLVLLEHTLGGLIEQSLIWIYFLLFIHVMQEYCAC